MTDDLLVWLGPAADAMTPEQIERTRVEAARIFARYPGTDHLDEYQAALSATVQHILGDVTPGDVERELGTARAREREAYAAALQVAVMLHADGERKSTAARLTGIDRMSLLKALGER